MFLTYQSYGDPDVQFYSELIKLAVGLIGRIVLGIITRKINKSKGYDGGFGWGFGLGVIGIIVVAVRRRDSSQETISSNRQMEKAVNAQIERESAQIKEEEEKVRRRAERMEAIRANKDGSLDAIDQFLLLAQDCQNDQELMELWEQLRPGEDEEVTEFLKNQVKAAKLYGGNDCKKSIRKIQSRYKPESVN